MNFWKHRKNLLIIVSLYISLKLPLFSGEPKINNLTMVPTNPNFGEEVTISFDLCINQYINPANIIIAVSISVMFYLFLQMVRYWL